MYNTGNINDLELLISEKQREIAALYSQLDAPKEEVIYNAGDGKVGYYGVGANADTEKRIYDLKVEIEGYRAKINQIKEIQKRNTQIKEQEEEQREKLQTKEQKESEEEAKLSEMQRKADFRRVRDLYKNSTNFLERALNKIKGVGLKKDYTQEELQFLISTYYGKTALQESKHRIIETSSPNYFEIDKRIKESNKNDFKKLIERQNIQGKIEQEEILKGRTR